MQKRSEKIFVNIFVNVIICLVIISVFSFSFAGDMFVFANAEIDKPIFKGNEQKNNVSLMFNVYQGTEYIDGILSVLDKNDVKVTFFVGGTWVSKNTDALQKLPERLTISFPIWGLYDMITIIILVVIISHCF